MSDMVYPAARTAAIYAQELYRTRKSAALARAVAGLSIEALTSVLDVAFWASLRREEGYAPRVSLAFVPVEKAVRPMLLEPPLRLTPAALTRLAPAVGWPGIHLGVRMMDSGEMVIWGTTQQLPPHALVVEIVAPGLIVVKFSRAEEAGKFLNLLVLEGDAVKVIDHGVATLPDCPKMLTPLLGLESQFRGEAAATGVLIQLAVAMRAHGRGGAMLVVPADTEGWRESIRTPLSYAVTPPFAAPAQWTAREIEAVAGLTAVDGATVINDRLEVLAFGAKIVRRRDAEPVNQLTISEPIAGTVVSVADATQLGGTRHLSAAQFAQDQRDALALVASQDGRFTIFGWSPCDQMVHARRVEALLL